jgi:hypothetical protein
VAAWPTTDLILKRAKAAKPAGADGTPANHPSVDGVDVPNRAHFDRVCHLVDAQLER